MPCQRLRARGGLRGRPNMSFSPTSSMTSLSSGSSSSADLSAFHSEIEALIRQEVVALGHPPIPSYKKLDLYALPSPLPKSPNYRLLSLLAIWGSERKQLRLSEICAEIDRRYPSLIMARPAFYDSLRHKLSLEPLFLNIKKSKRRLPGDSSRGRVAFEDRKVRGNPWTLNIERLCLFMASGQQDFSLQLTSYPPSPSHNMTIPHHNQDSIFLDQADIYQPQDTTNRIQAWMEYSSVLGLYIPTDNVLNQLPNFDFDPWVVDEIPAFYQSPSNFNQPLYF